MTIWSRDLDREMWTAERALYESVLFAVNKSNVVIASRAAAWRSSASLTGLIRRLRLLSMTIFS
jgi:hypothetical protein